MPVTPSTESDPAGPCGECGAPATVFLYLNIHHGRGEPVMGFCDRCYAQIFNHGR
jgi:hypothetical protein